MFSYLDFLSPPITLFYLEKRTHTSKIGGCLVIILVSICVSYICNLLYYVISHNRVTSIFFKKFEFEAGRYSFNSSSIFHFIQIFSPESGGYFDKYDNRYIRAYTTYVHSNFKISDLHLYDHWVFDTCRKDIDDKDLEKSLFENVVNFTNAVCIRHFYNSTEKKYYSLEEKGFFWPYLEHGIAQRNNIYLTTIVQKCTNDSIINKIFGDCPSQKEIDDYISQYFGIYLYFTDTQVDPTNYEMPIQKYLQTISTGIGTSQTYVESYIHYSPIKVRTNEGSLFGDTHEINSFYFDFNRKGSADNNSKYFIITKYYHLMQNNVQIYERKYNNIFDLLSEIGGVIQFLFYIFFWVNYLYNKYIISYDTNSLFFAVKDNQIKQLDIKRDFNNILQYSNINSNANKNLNYKINILNASDDNFEKIKLKMPIQKYSSLKLSPNYKNNAFLKDKELSSKENISKNPNFNKRKTANIINSAQNFYYLNAINLTKNLNQNAFRKSKNMLGIDMDSSDINLRNNNNFIFNIDERKTPKSKDIKMTKTINYSTEDNYYNKIYLSKHSLAKIDHKTIESNAISNKEKMKSFKNLSFNRFFKYLCFKEKGSISFLIKFRKHLLSEEHLFKSHIKTILLEKEFSTNNNKGERTNVFECFNEL